VKRQAWIAFWLLGLIWGSSFLLIRVGVEQLRPIEIVFIRTAIAAVGLNAVIWLRRVPFPTDWPTLRALFIIGLGNVVAPFMLITWGEQFVPSGLAAVLQSTAALFTLVVAHFVFTDERINRQKIIGLIVGFIGVVVLFSSELTPEKIASGNLLGGLAVVVASMFYAAFTSFSRKVIQGQVAPIVMAGGTMTVAALATAPIVFFTEGGLTPLNTLDSRIILSVVTLGLVNTFIAYLFYYSVVRELGASRASMITYIVPPVGIVLGALLLQETVGPSLLIGAGLIFSGIAIVNLKVRGGMKGKVGATQPLKAEV
jgi:drug/metabolite transporter (DMT)-like permease